MGREMEQKNKGRIQGFILAFSAGLLWGASSPIAQFLFEEKGIVSSWLVPYRLLLAGLLLLAFAAVKRMPLIEVWKERNDAVRLCCFAVLGMMGMQYSFFAAVQEMNAGTATIFQYLNPAMLIIYFVVVYRIVPKGREIAAMLCSLVGIFLVATHGNIHQLSVSWIGIVLGMLLALTTCFYGVIPMPLLKKYQAEVVCAWAMLIGGVVLTLATRPWKIKAEIDVQVIIAFLAIVVMGTILPFCFYLAALKKIGSVYSGLLSSVEPVAATVLAAVFLGTKFQTIDVIGFALVLSTMFILNVGNMKEKKE